ncbi:MAG: anti-sigma F factor [Vulcanibacillus sp.]
MKLQFQAKSINESFARVVVASFISQLDLTLEDLNDFKTVVSEAVTNSIIHGYEENSEGIIFIETTIKDELVELSIEDSGKGIENINEATQALFTTKPELERSGMGFTIMENLMDDMSIISEVGKGTKVVLIKRITKNSTTG